MRAVLIEEAGGPDNLWIGTVDRPVPRDDELLVRVRATALNRADLMQREGRYPPPDGASPILGLDMAGTVEDVGRDCRDWHVGERVCGLLSGGGYAEYAVIHHDMAIRIRPSLSFEEAAAIPEVFLTSHQALYWYGNLREGNRVLIHAGASGVGTAAIQLVRVEGGTPYVTASRSKHKACLDLGAAAAVDYRTEDFARRVEELTGGAGVALILDFIGAPYFEKNIDALSVDGCMVMLATMGGSRAPALDLRNFFRKRATLTASTLRNREQSYKIRLTQDFVSRHMPRFESGELRAVIDHVYDWSDVAAAHRRMEENLNVGKIVLRIT